ncbi:MAG: hypothetical protein ACI841_000516 [Planctomycetota bacterium]|jgi:hypothetical protein
MYSFILTQRGLENLWVCVMGLGLPTLKLLRRLTSLRHLIFEA